MKLKKALAAVVLIAGSLPLGACGGSGDDVETEQTIALEKVWATSLSDDQKLMCETFRDDPAHFVWELTKGDAPLKASVAWDFFRAKCA